MLDNVEFYNKALQYGNVAMGKTAWSEVSYLYHKSRVSGLVYDQIAVIEDESTNFYYIQNKEYVEAYKNYVTNKNIAGDTQDGDTINEMYVRTGGENDGTYAPANGSFRTFLGEIKEESDVKEVT